MAVASVVASMGSRHTGSVVVAPGLVGSSWTRARTSVPCAGRRIPIHRTTREVQQLERAHAQQRRPPTAKINKSLKKKKKDGLIFVPLEAESTISSLARMYRNDTPALCWLDDFKRNVPSLQRRVNCRLLIAQLVKNPLAM